MYQFLTIERKDAIATVRFNRPEQLNAMNRMFMDEIICAFQELNDDSRIRVVLVTGNGRAFMAGADIKEYAVQTDEQFLAFQERGIQLYQQAERSKKPFIAVVNGFALGGGFEIACACDMIIASNNASFGLPEVHLGLIPGGGGTQRLIQKIGVNRIKQMLYLGDQYSAQQMHAWGIVNYIAEPEYLTTFSEQIAQKLSRRSPEAIAQLKRLVYLSTCPIDLDNRMKDEGKTVFDLFRTEQAKERIENFIHKNK
ncbi:enoyl-CoA hydratase/isomerase family protein [Oscillospiraceae bacterium PP1C4]